MTNETTTATERAPSATNADQFVIARIVGLAGLFLSTLGIIGYIANQYKPVWFGEGGCLIAGVLGLCLLSFHAIRDRDLEIRRVYGLLAAILLVVGMIVSIVPGKAGEATVSKLGFQFLPWGMLSFTVALVFLIAFVKNETDTFYKETAKYSLLAFGGLFSITAVYLGLFQQMYLLGHAPVLALLGLGYLITYFTEEDTSTGTGYSAALGLGILGVVALAVAIGLTVGPTVLFDGPAALRKPNQSLDIWKVFGRVIGIALGLCSLFCLKQTAWPLWVRSTLICIGLAWSGLLIAGFTQTGYVTAPPKPYLVPFGFILAMIGIMNLMVSIGVCSESTFVVLTRRELTSFFYSPIIYIVLGGVTVLAAFGHLLFLSSLMSTQQGAMGPVQAREPIVQFYWSYTWIAEFQVWLLVPLLTMRALSEEKRTNTLEMLVTAPINDWTIVLSKALSTWLIYLVTWLPATIFLVALRVVGNQPFDFTPVLSYFVAVAASGVLFIGMGMFFSALTSNQIISGMLTAAGMLVMFLAFLMERFTNDMVSPAFIAAVRKLSYFTLWNQSLSGSLFVSDLVLQISLGVFALFLTVKVLEIRKWS